MADRRSLSRGFGINPKNQSNLPSLVPLGLGWTDNFLITACPDRNGAYSYTTKDLITLNLDSSGNLRSWVHPAGPSVTFSYSGGKVALVASGLGRTLTFIYSGDEIIRSPTAPGASE